MNKYVFTRGALDKSISLCPVEPLYCSLLSHSTAPFAYSRRIHSPRLPEAPWRSGAPPQFRKNRSRYRAADKTAPTEKAPVLPRRPDTETQDSWSPTKREFRLLDT